LIAAEAEIRLRAGQRERALELLEESLALAESTSEYIYLPETHRLRAAARSDPDEARHDLSQAWEIADSQDAYVYSLRALLDMGALPESHSNDLGDRINVVLLAMGEPESYPEHAQAIEFLAGLE
jgi:tetratricopeptide (TPR) repeat protein